MLPAHPSKSVQKNMPNALNFSKNKLHRRYFDNNLQEFSRTNIIENVTGYWLFFDSCFNGRLMVKQSNDLNFKWSEFVKLMLSLLAVREICDILVVDKDLSKVVKTDQESSPVVFCLHGAHLFC